MHQQIIKLHRQFRPLVGFKYNFHEGDNNFPIRLHLQIKKEFFMVCDARITIDVWDFSQIRAPLSPLRRGGYENILDHLLLLLTSTSLDAERQGSHIVVKW